WRRGLRSWRRRASATPPARCRSPRRAPSRRCPTGPTSSLCSVSPWPEKREKTGGFAMTTTFQIEATDAQIASFRANGFLAIDAISTADEVARLRDLYDQVMANADAWRIKYEGASDDGDVINQVFLPELQAPEMGDTTYFRNGKR